MSLVFASVQKLLQTSTFSLIGYRGCSPLFARVGVKLVSNFPSSAYATAYWKVIARPSTHASSKASSPSRERTLAVVRS